MNPTPNPSLRSAATKLFSLLIAERGRLLAALGLMILGSGLNLLAPFLYGHAVDAYVRTGTEKGIFVYAAILLGTFVVAFVCQYAQMQLMGRVGQFVLFRLRNDVFTKLQELPIAFFAKQKAGDLISRINNDTDKLNQFFSETLVRFVGNVFMIAGAGVCLVIINPRLGGIALIPAAVLLLITQMISGWVKRQNAAGLQTMGAMSAEIQEHLDNFNILIAFHRQDFFRNRFASANANTFAANIRAGIANGVFSPIYDLTSSVATLLVVTFGIAAISHGTLTIGILLSFLIYIERFYMPLRQLASLWSSLQLAMAGWDRVSAILTDPTRLHVREHESREASTHLLEFQGVRFQYPDGKDVLRHATFALDAGKTYALVGPTGGGKTTTASLMARLYDPTDGTILFHGQDLASYTSEERANRIGFILQEPFLFSGTVRENIFYGNTTYGAMTADEQRRIIEDAGLSTLLARFDQGLETPIAPRGNTMSLGQRQLIAFMRAVLRKPELLILDEATANIDTITEQLLEEILAKLPATTTRVIIAHRLNTIENADEIFFVNGGDIVAAGSLEHAVDMLLHGHRSS